METETGNCFDVSEVLLKEESVLGPSIESTILYGNSRITHETSDDNAEETLNTNLKGLGFSNSHLQNEVTASETGDNIGRINSLTKARKKSRVISDDSDEETDFQNEMSYVPSESQRLANEENTSGEENVLKVDDEINSSKMKSLKKKKRSRVISDDSESEGELNSIKNNLSESEGNQHKGQDKQENTSGEENTLKNDNKVSKTKSSKKKKKSRLASDNSESDDEINSIKDHLSDPEEKSPNSTNSQEQDKNLSKNSYKNMFQNSDLYDAEGSSDEEHHPQNKSVISDTQVNIKDSKEGKKKTTSQRKAKKSALEEIHSETQRLIRQSRVSLPYHQPKQHSLSEFLSRRKVLPIMPLKTSSDQLTEVWKKIEEREKSAETFYKSESDESDTDCKKDAKPDITEKDASNSANSDSIACDNNQNNKDTEILQINDGSKPCDNLEKSIDSQLLKNTDDSGISTSNEKSSNDGSDSQREDSSSDIPSHQFSERDNKDFLNDTCKKTSATFSEEFSLSISENDTPEIGKGTPNFTDSENSEKMSALESTLSICRRDSVISDQDYTNKPPNCNLDEVELKKKRNSLLNKSLLDVKFDVVPKISGNPEDVIDLETCSDKPAAFNLVSRFMKHVQLKPKRKKQEENISIAFTEVNEKGEVINLTEEIVNIKVGEKSKPCETRVQLKAKLKEKIAQAREEQFVKRIEEYKLSEEMFDDGTCDIASDFEENEEFDFLGEPETESEPEEDDVKIVDKIKDKANPFFDEEAEESENEDENEEEVNRDGDEDKDEEGEEKDKEDEEEIDEEDSQAEEFDNYSDPPSVDIAPLIEELDKDSNDMKPDKSQDANNLESINGFMDLCSGVFPSQAVDLADLEKNDNSEQQSMSLSLVLPEDSTLDLLGSNKKRSNDDDSSDEEIVSKKNKKKVKLTFSDDEDDLDDSHSVNKVKNLGGDDSEEENEDGVEDVENNDDGDVDVENEDEILDEDVIDEEEEELLHNPSAAAKRYLEDEAELSGSEYGSADEDEVDLDNYEEEDGDQEKINQRKVRSELEKIHMKEMLDEDKREIRILQELLLEDGELHSDGPKRQRQFKWYNQDDAALDSRMFSAFDDDDDEKKADVEGEEEEDESWRKTRLERENFLRDCQGADGEFDKFNNFKKYLKLDTSKPSLKTPNMPKTNTVNAVPSPNPMKQFPISKRGSFLSRGEKLLSRLAEITNISSDNPVANSRGKRNMVFAVVSPPKEPEPAEQAPKRKSTDLLPAAKRLKFSSKDLNNSKGSILEKLRLSDL